MEAVSTIIEAQIQHFFWKEVICRFGIPHTLITDNGKQFDNEKFKIFCSELGIKLRFTSVAHPQTNGQTKVTNRTIMQGLKRRLDEKKRYLGRGAQQCHLGLLDNAQIIDR